MGNKKLYFLGGAIFIGGLFFYFYNKKNNKNFASEIELGSSCTSDSVDCSEGCRWIQVVDENGNKTIFCGRGTTRRMTKRAERK